MSLAGKHILITGAAVRVGAALARAVAAAGGTVLLHYHRSADAAARLHAELSATGARAHLLQADLSQPQRAAALLQQAQALGPVDGLVNSAAIFEDLTLETTSAADWQRHLDLNLTTPFLLSQAFWRAAGQRPGHIINILDWRALRPAGDHLPYTISKVALAGLTRALALSMAPHIRVNGIALGAILPPSDGGEHAAIIKDVPTGRWATLDEVGQTLLFLLTGPSYITGEIIHLDGGRHLV